MAGIGSLIDTALAAEIDLVGGSPGASAAGAH
jgi:hypothetical protein